MKRILGLLMVGVMLVGCGSGEGFTEVDKVDKVDKVVEVEEVEEGIGAGFKEHSIVEGIEEAIQGISFRVIGIVPGHNTRYAMRLEIENKNDFNANLWTDRLVANGAVHFDRHLIFLQAGEKLEYDIEFRNPERFGGDFEYIEEVQVKFVVTADSLPVAGVHGEYHSLKTDYYTGNRTIPEKRGDMVFFNENLSIYGERIIAEDFDGIRLLVVNDVGADVNVRIRESLVNGKPIDTERNLGVIPKDTYALMYDRMNSFEMQKYGIDKIETIEIGFSFHNAETGDLYYYMDPVIIE